MLGLVICAGSAVLIALGFLLPGGVLLLIASGFDILDGALARVSGHEQSYGAFLDSTVDRYAEAMTSIGDASDGAAFTPSTNAWRNCCCP